MLPELGSFAIILALCFALIQFVSAVFPRLDRGIQGMAPSTGSRGQAAGRRYISIAAVIGQTGFLAFAMLCLIMSFITNDMTVIYVREHSHTLLPFIYRVGAAWGGHEGSLLLWCLILSGWTLAFVMFSRPVRYSVISVLGFISAGFILFLFLTSNPFQRIFPTELVKGNDLTPILQDPGLIFHPPMLYLGYVGFAIAFAFAISALIEGKFDQAAAKACRPWIILPWSFLSCGIVLGSWWAYRELGWGGWWFWDPVENASLLPWLSSTALIHSLIVSEKRDTFKGWTILLAIVTFTLSLLGTFLVRSGVLVSVHAFANDPTRGLFLLAYLALIIGGALVLYAGRIHCFYKSPNFSLFSRESFLLINTVFLLTATFTIVLGTLYPIVLDALNYGKISVGEPYFNTVFLPIMLPLLLLMGFVPHVHWQEQTFSKIIKKLSPVLLISIAIGFLSPWVCGFEFHLLASVGITFAVWIILATIFYVIRLDKVNLSHWAMVVAHIGIAVIALGITINKSYSEERQVKIKVGEDVVIGGYQLVFKDISKIQGKNYESIAAIFDIYRNNQAVGALTTEQRVYTAHQEVLSKPGIQFTVFRDLYVALGNAFSNDTWSVRFYYKPFVRWIWAGGFMLLIAGFLSLLSYWKKHYEK